MMQTRTLVFLRLCAVLVLLLAAAACEKSDTKSTRSNAGGTPSGGAAGMGGNKASLGGAAGASSYTLAVAGDTGHSRMNPTIVANNPVSGAIGVPTNGTISATFSEAMDASTMTPSRFTLTSGAANTPVVGTVSYADSKAVFVPTAVLASHVEFTATISAAAKSAAGIALAAPYVWTFTTGDATSGLPVDLGSAGNFVILAKSGISTVPTSAITGNVGLSPAAATFITGFSLVADATNTFATSSQISGKAYASDYATPIPTQLTAAVSAMQLAYTGAAQRAPDHSELGAGSIGGMTLNAGVYAWSTGLSIPSSLTLHGDASAVWVFQIAKDLKLSSGVNVALTGGALAKNVFWQVAGLVDFGTTSHFEGIVLTQTSVTMKSGASMTGRLLAQTAVTIDRCTIVEPAP